MYAKAKRSLPEMYSFSVCLWIKSNASPGVGTPFSYAVPGQANELVLIEWGNNPMEILINDKVVQVVDACIYIKHVRTAQRDFSGCNSKKRFEFFVL